MQQWKLKHILPQIILVLVILLAGGACGRKDPVQQGASALTPTAPDAYTDPGNYTNTPPPNTNALQLQGIVSGTYKGTLYTRRTLAWGQATVYVQTDAAFNVAVTITHPSLNPSMVFYSTLLGYRGNNLIGLNYPWNGQVGKIDSRQVWVYDAYIQYNLSGAAQLFLFMNAVDYSYSTFGWDLFSWSTYSSEAAGWIHIDNLVKVGP